MTRSQAIEMIVTAVPYANQIHDWDVSDEDEREIRFTWRGARYRVDYSNLPHVEEVNDGMLSGSDIAILMEALLKRTHVDLLQRWDKRKVEIPCPKS